MTPRLEAFQILGVQDFRVFFPTWDVLTASISYLAVDDPLRYFEVFLLIDSSIHSLISYTDSDTGENRIFDGKSASLLAIFAF